MDKLKVAVVGAGNRGPQHMTTIVGIPDRFDLVGICDMDDEKREAAVAKFAAPGFTQLEDMLDKAKPDLVCLIVSQSALPTLVPIVAQAGVHMATETPISASLPQADLVIKAAADGGVKLENFEQCWRWPREQLKWSIMDSGVLGATLQVRCYTYVAPYHANAVFRRMAGDQRVKKLVGFGRDLPQSPTQAREGQESRPRKWVVAGVEFENGLTGVWEAKIQASRLSGHDFTNVSADFENGHIVHDKIYISREAAKPKEGGAHNDGRRMVEYTIQEGWEDLQGHNILTSVWIDTDPVMKWENPYKQYAPEPIYAGSDDYGRLEEYIHYHRVILNDEEPEYGVERARHNAEVMIAAYHSAQNNSQVMEFPIDPTIETSFW